MDLFGEKQAGLIKEALALIAERKIGLPCYSSTASVNKEVEKQNDVMMSQVMARHYQMIAQLLGSMQSGMTPPKVKEYFAEVVVASNALMRRMLKNFGYDEVEEFVPEPEQGGEGEQPSRQPNAQLPPGQGPSQPPQQTPPTFGRPPEMVGVPGGTPIQ
jgi:hypothetical protein